MVNISEIIFSLAYLVIMTVIIIFMLIKLKKINPDEKSLAKLFIAAFSLLLIGDGFHLVTRIIAITNSSLPTISVLMGFGSITTAITFTIFFMIFASIWCKKSNCNHNALWWILISIGIIRLIILLLPQNDWFGESSSRTLQLIRNAFLIIQGFSTGYVFIKYGLKYKNRLFKSMGFMIIISFLVYLPAYLFTKLSYQIIITVFILHTICYIITAFITAKWFYINAAS